VYYLPSFCPLFPQPIGYRKMGGWVVSSSKPLKERELP
jgi:hypothetical protein